MILANRLDIPDSAVALLWDMDGVLIDSLTFDYEVCNQILQSQVGADVRIPHSLIKELFPLDIHQFWQKILERIGVSATTEVIARLATSHDLARQGARFPLNPGITEILEAARRQGLLLAVVSNNQTEQVKEILHHADLLNFFDAIVGNDIEHIAKKPAPDTYLLAAKLLVVDPVRCVVVEDSLFGGAAGRSAGCYTIGVATGADSFAQLNASPLIDCAYTSFADREIVFRPGTVTEKFIVTPNEFVSHMLEHLAWRLGCSITVRWNNADWVSLGQAVGTTLAKFPRKAGSAAVLGMIDDGSAEVRVTTSDEHTLSIQGTAQVDVDWFLASRCEQLSSGKPLVDFLKGMAAAFPMRLDILVCNFEDPHHTWEGIFRSVGIALNAMVMTTLPDTSITPIGPVGNSADAETRHWTLVHESPIAVELLRKTAESEVRVVLDFSRNGPPQCHFDVANSINIDGLPALLEELTHQAQCQLELWFKATRINSSHVVMEDTGMVIGRALKTILIQRMLHSGINGAGSSVTTSDDLGAAPIGVGLSIEGRKFWTFVPFQTNYAEFRRRFLIGHTIGAGLFSEDLDDFLDGFAGGISGSIIVHVRRTISPQEGWPLIFRSLGQAIHEAITPNPARKGLPPGVKATLD